MLNAAAPGHSVFGDFCEVIPAAVHWNVLEKVTFFAVLVYVS